MRFLALIVMLGLAAAGCSSPPSDPIDGGAGTSTFSQSRSNTSTPPRPPPSQELLNASLGFPALMQGQNEQASFQVPRGADKVQLTHQAQADCDRWPVVVVERARLRVGDPGGNQTELVLDPFLAGDQGVMPCPVLGNPVYDSMVSTFVGIEGVWTVETLGNFTGRVRVTAINDP